MGSWAGNPGEFHRALMNRFRLRVCRGYHEGARHTFNPQSPVVRNTMQIGALARYVTAKGVPYIACDADCQL